MNNDIISIIVPTYNCRDYAKECIENKKEPQRLLFYLQKIQKSFRHLNSLKAFWAAARDSFARATAPSFISL